MDIFTKQKRSMIMSQVRSKETKLEQTGWKLLRKSGLRFRSNPKGIFGNPDAANKSKKIAVFFDSEFWHGYEWEKNKKNIKSNKKFWVAKIERNIERDKVVNNYLHKAGWKVIRIWSKDLQKKNEEKTLNRILKII